MLTRLYHTCAVVSNSKIIPKNKFHYFLFLFFFQFVRNLLLIMSCPEGKIKRVGYSATRSSTGKTYKVKPTCIRDVGKPGKTPSGQRIISDDELDLSVYGYSNIADMKADERHKVLGKAINGISSSDKKSEHEAAVKVMRRLNYLFVLTRNTQVTLSKLLERDRNWIGRTYLGKDYTA